MDKKQNFGKYFYYASMIISIVLLVLAVFFINVKDIEDEELLITKYIYRYIIIIAVLFLIIPTGAFVREITSGVYNKKLLLIKILLAYLGGVGSILAIWFLRNLIVAKTLSFVGALVLVFSASPTVREQKKWDSKEYMSK